MQVSYHKHYDLLLYSGLEPRQVTQITDAIVAAKPLNGELVGVPRTLSNLQLLRWLDYPVVPIIDDYDWPIESGKVPLEHQKIMANFMVLHPRCFNLSDMGTMK